MTFLVVAGVSGVVLMVASVVIARYFRAKWKMERGLFWRAGLALLVIEIFYFAVIDGFLSWYPEFLNMHIVLQALIIGVTGGLFYELGRFFVLDKLFKKVRGFKEGIYFGLGWSGVATFVVGFFTVILAIGVSLIISADDVTELMPDVTPEQAEEYKALANRFVEGDFWLGIEPLLNRGLHFVLDVVMTLVILYGFMAGTTMFVWVAAGYHALFITALFIAGDAGGVPIVVTLLAFLALTIFFFKKVARDFPRDMKAKRS